MKWRFWPKSTRTAGLRLQPSSGATELGWWWSRGGLPWGSPPPLCYLTLNEARQCKVMLRNAIARLGDARLGDARLCDARLCYAVLRYDRQSYSMPGYAM